MRVGLAGDAHHARTRLHSDVHAGLVGERAFAIGGDIGIDQPFVDGAELVVAEAEPLHHAWPEILHGDIGPARQVPA